MQADLEIVDWYITVLEGGHNTKTLLKDFVQATQDLKALKLKSDRKKEKLNNELALRSKQLKDTKIELIKLQEDVLNPLIKESKIKEHLNQRLLK